MWNKEPGGELSGTDESAYVVEVVRDTEGMRALRTDWETLVRAAPQPNIFSTFDWCWGSWKYAAPASRQQELNILILRRSGKVTGIFPAMLRTARGGGMKFNKLEFIGGGDLPDYQGPVCDGDLAEQARSVVRHLLVNSSAWDILEFHNLAPEILQPLQAAFSEHLRVQVEAGEWVPLVSIKPSDAASELGAKTRRTLQNVKNRWASAGVTSRLIERPALEPELLERMIAVERRRRIRGKPVDDLLAGWPEFFGYILRELGSRGWITIAVAEKGPDLIAYDVVFRCGKKLWAYTGAYDPTFAKLSPGTVLTAVVLEYAHSLRCEEYDFLRGSEDYKLRLADGLRPTSHLLAWHHGWRSRAAAHLYFHLHRPVVHAYARLREAL
jgi:CelD/BcsL family acetyltransferase involved in cellulose biosynthesis